MKQLPEEKWESCPNTECNNTGGYPEYVGGYSFVTRDMAIDAGDMSLEGQACGWPIVEEVQCEFCWTNCKSIFFQKNRLYSKNTNEDT